MLLSRNHHGIIGSTYERTGDAIVKIVTMLTADSAFRDPNTGKLNLLGLFRTIYSQSFPAKHKHMTLVIVVESEGSEDTGSHQIRIEWTNDDASESNAIEGTIQLGQSIAAIPSQAEVIVNIEDFALAVPGQYRFDVSLDGGDILGSSVVNVARLVQNDQQT